MARSLQNIIQSINDEADTHQELSTLQENPSRVSVWNYIKQVIAFVAHSLERLFDDHERRVEQLLEQQQVGTPKWYVRQALLYQHGTKVGIVQHRPGYAIVDPSLQIVKHAAVEIPASPAGTLYMKVVKGGANETLVPLSPEEELKGFQSYMNAITFAGIRVVASSASAVKVKINATVQVNLQLITLEGTQIGSEKNPVEDAINAYFRALPFNGWVRVSAIEDAMQNVPGVIDIYINSLEYLSPTNAWVRFRKSFRPASGHAELESTSQFAYQENIITD